MAALLGDAWSTDESERLVYGYDNSRRMGAADAVALPTTREQVLALVAPAATSLPLVARGRGTNTTGATRAGRGGVVVSFERMDRILASAPATAAPWSSRACSTATCSARWPRTACSGRQTRPAPTIQHHRRQPGLQCRRPARGEIRRHARQRARA